MRKLCHVWLFTSALFFYSYYAQAGMLPVPYWHQEGSQWCWAATSQGILDYFGNSPTQCQIANWAFSRSDCCTTPLPAGCNVPNFLYATGGSVQSILQHFGPISSVGQADVLSVATVMSEMNAGRPFVMGWKWTSGGGHILTAKGFAGSDATGTMYVHNPGGRADAIMSYNEAVGQPGHLWTQTLRITGRTMPSVNVSINGNEGPTLNVTPSTYLNVNISLNPNGRSDWADWWVGYDLNGIRYYLTAAGVTTTPTPWRQAQLTAMNQSVYNGTLPVGNYTMYFAVDLTRNGVLDGDIYWDFITVQVH